MLSVYQLIIAIRAGFLIKVVNAFVLRIKAAFTFTSSAVFFKLIYEQLRNSYLRVSLSATNTVKRVIWRAESGCFCFKGRAVLCQEQEALRSLLPGGHI